MSNRAPAVAGLFYTGEAGRLGAEVRGYLAAAAAEGPAPKAMILPHAGHIYSGPIAASGYARLAPARDTVTRVVLIGPSHYVPLRGLAASSADSFATPLGKVPVDRPTIDRLLALPQVALMDAAHEREHSLEVHLPFLQAALDAFSLVPLVAGSASAEDVAEVLEAAWGGPETLIVVSSDLSHYHDYETARRMDAATSAAIEALTPEDIGDDRACGRVPIGGLLRAAARHGLAARTVDLRNSGDTAGPKSRVVGYGAWVFEPAGD
ncbi:MAG: AmmeMemoRadiSam system protein B [Alphaproteobacteria bacterium]